MAKIGIAPLGQRLSDEEIEELAGGLEDFGAPQLPHAADETPMTLGDGLDDDALVEFLDRLESHDLACEIFLPVEFDGRVEVADLRVGSTSALLDALEEIRDELDIDEDEEADDEADPDDDDEDLVETKLRTLWRLFYAGAQASVERSLPLHIHHS